MSCCAHSIFFEHIVWPGLQRAQMRLTCIWFLVFPYLSFRMKSCYLMVLVVVCALSLLVSQAASHPLQTQISEKDRQVKNLTGSYTRGDK